MACPPPIWRVHLPFFLSAILLADWWAVLGNFAASPGFGFIKKMLHLPLGWWSFCESGLKQMWAIAISFSG
jgi:hypothetical protein